MSLKNGIGYLLTKYYSGVSPNFQYQMDFSRRRSLYLRWVRYFRLKAERSVKDKLLMFHLIKQKLYSDQNFLLALILYK